MKTPFPRQLRVSLAILRYAIQVFLATGRNIIAKMTGNLNYATPFPALADVTAALDALEAAMQAAAGHDRPALAAQAAALAAAKSLFRQLAAYVQAHCQNDLTILMSSGFNATKTPAPIGPLPAPHGLVLRRTNLSGELRLRFRQVYGTTAGYTVQTAPAATGPFTDYVTSSSCRVLLKGLPTMATTWVQVRATGTAGAGRWSGPVCMLVL